LAEDIAQLGIKIAVDAGESETRIRSIQAMADRAGVSFETMYKRVQAATGVVREFGQEAAKTTSATASASDAMRRASAEAERVTASGLSQRSMWRPLVLSLEMPFGSSASFPRRQGSFLLF
jgi:hypothetical protein